MNMSAKTIFVAVLHDRHTDDELIGYSTIEDAIQQCKDWAEHNYRADKYSFREVSGYGEYCLFCTDDYNMRVEKILLWPPSDLLEQE